MPETPLPSLKNKVRLCLLTISVASAEADKGLCAGNYDKADELLKHIEREVEHARNTLAKIQDTGSSGD